MKRIIVSLLSLVVLIISISGEAQAAPTAQSAVSVSPAIEQLQLAAGQDTADFPVSIRNNTETAIQVKIGFADFKALNDTGGVAFLGQNSSSLQNKHGLVNWVQLGSEQVGLDPGQGANISVHLASLQSLPPGGHYGAITYTVVPKSSGALGNHILFNQVLSSLVFITTADGGTQHLKMLPPSGLGWLRLNLPASLDLFFKNDGNTQTSPRGSVAIYSGKKPDNPVATAIINHGSALSLPDSVRQLPTGLTVLHHSWWPHRYHVLVQYRPDGVQNFSTYRTGFWYMPPIFFPIAILIIWAMRRIRRYWLRRQRKPTVSNEKSTAKRLVKPRRALYTLRVESILVWRDFKLFLRWLRRKVFGQAQKQGSKPKKNTTKTKR